MNYNNKTQQSNMKTIHNLATQRSLQMQNQFNQSRHFQQRIPQSLQSQREFSFNRQISPSLHINLNTNGRTDILKDKYADIYNDLKIMEQADVIELLLEELEENQKCKKQLVRLQNRVVGLEQENNQFKDIIKKKREAIQLLCDTESKNLQLIQKLENKISKKNEYGRDTHYQKKYQQLSVYMNEYIRSINLAQQQFKRAYTNLKGENSRLHEQVERLSNEYDQLFKRYQILNQRIRRYEFEVNELGETKTKLSSSLNILAEQNQILKKQIEIFQENIRITDRLEIHVQKQRHQLSSQLDFIRDKICENQNISRDIIQKLEQSSSDCEKVSKDKQRFFESLQRQKQKTQNLEKENISLKKKNQQLEQDIKILKKQFDFVASERDELEDDLMQQKLEKESIRKQLLSLADKVRQMQSTYRKQIQQSEKIKGELFRFWQTKQKKQPSSSQKQGIALGQHDKILSQIKQSNENSQTTLSISQKQSKLSLWHKKSEYELNSSIIHEKQNQQNYSKDSICQ